MFKTRNIVIGLMSAAAMVAASSAQADSMPFMPRGGLVGAPSGFAELCHRDLAACGIPSAQLVLLGARPGESSARTSSLGGGSPAALSAQATESLRTEDEAGLIAIETVEAVKLGHVDDFVAAGELRLVPAAQQAPMEFDWASRDERDQMKLLNRINQEINRAVKKASDLEIYGQDEYWALPRLVDGKLYGDCEDYALEKRRKLIAAGVPETALSLAVAVTARGEGHAVLVVSMENGDWVLDNLTPWATPWRELNYTWIERQLPGTALWTRVT